MYLFIGEGAISTVPIEPVSNFDKIVYSTHHLKGKGTSIITKSIETNIGGKLENRIQTIWQFMLIILAVLSVLAFTYLGKCLHRQWTSRAVQVSNTRTSSPDIALDVSNRIEYEQIQNVEYEDPERYLTVANDDSQGGGINHRQEKMDSSSIRPSNEEALNEEHKCENVMYENQSNKGVREADDLYLTPIT